MGKYKKLTDWQIIKHVLKCVKKVNKDKMYEHEILSDFERNQVVDLICKKLGLNESQATWLLDNYSESEGLAEKLYDMQPVFNAGVRRTKSFLEMKQIKKRIGIELCAAGLLFLLFGGFAFGAVYYFINNDEMTLSQFVIGFALCLMFSFMAIIYFFMHKRLMFTKIKPLKTCADKRISGKIKKISLYMSDRMLNVDIEYAKIKIEHDYKTRSYILPLAFKHISTKSSTCFWLSKNLTKKLKDSQHFFIIEEDVVILDMQPTIIHEIKSVVEKSKRSW